MSTLKSRQSLCESWEVGQMFNPNIIQSDSTQYSQYQDVQHKYHSIRRQTKFTISRCSTQYHSICLNTIFTISRCSTQISFNPTPHNIHNIKMFNTNIIQSDAKQNSQYQDVQPNIIQSASTQYSQYQDVQPKYHSIRRRTIFTILRCSTQITFNPMRYPTPRIRDSSSCSCCCCSSEKSPVLWC